MRAPLDRVRKGQPLAELYVPDWVAAQEEYLSLQAHARAPASTALVDGARAAHAARRHDRRADPPVEASGKVQPRLTLTAPIGGVVAELGVREGMTVMPGATLFRINGLSTVWVNAEVPESQAALVRPGSRVEARAPALPGSDVQGQGAARSCPKSMRPRARSRRASSSPIPAAGSSRHVRDRRSSRASARKTCCSCRPKR